MARLTVEQKWWIDPRRQSLMKALGHGHDVDGLMIQVWRIAQEYWAEGTLVPWRVFSKFEGHKQIVEADLIEIRTSAEHDSNTIYELPNSPELASKTFVYVCGSKDFFTWILDVREKRRAGGKKSAEARRKKYGSAVPKNASNTGQKPNKRRTPTEVKPNSSEVSGSGSGSVFGSGSGELSEGSCARGEVTPITDGHDSKSFIAAYCEAFKARYQTNPPITGKDAGTAKNLVKALGVTKAQSLIATYLTMNDAFFLTRRHDLTTFQANLNAVTVKHDTGQGMTRTQARHAETQDYHTDQLKRVQEGLL